MGGMSTGSLWKLFLLALRSEGSFPALDPLHPDQEAAILFVDATLAVSFERLEPMLRETILMERQALADMFPPDEVLAMHVRGGGTGHEFWPISVKDAIKNVRPGLRWERENRR